MTSGAHLANCRNIYEYVAEAAEAAAGKRFISLAVGEFFHSQQQQQQCDYYYYCQFCISAAGAGRRKKEGIKNVRSTQPASFLPQGRDGICLKTLDTKKMQSQS